MDPVVAAVVIALAVVLAVRRISLAYRSHHARVEHDIAFRESGGG